MKISEPNRANALRMFNASKRCLLIMPFAAGILAIWSPYYPKYLVTSAIVGVLFEGFTWLVWACNPSRLINSLIPTVMWIWLMASIIFVSKHLALGQYILVFSEALAVLLSASAVTGVLLGAWFKKELADTFTSNKRTNLPE